MTVVVSVEVILVHFVEVISRKTQIDGTKKRKKKNVIKRIEIEPSIGVTGVGINHDKS